MKSSQNMNMKSLNTYRNAFDATSFDLEHEANMVQSRILSSLLEVIEKKGLTQLDLEVLTGLKQPFLSAVFNNRKKINMEHIALLQNALDIVLQPPAYLTKDQHLNKFYDQSDFESAEIDAFELACRHPHREMLKNYRPKANTQTWNVSTKTATTKNDASKWRKGDLKLAIGYWEISNFAIYEHQFIYQWCRDS